MASAIGYQANFVRKPSMKWLNAVARLAPGVDERGASAVGTTVLRAVDAAQPARRCSASTRSGSAACARQR